MAVHPYRQAFEQRNLDQLTELLADDVVFHSPVINEPGFEGRDAVRALLAIALDAVEVNSYTHEFGEEGAHVLISDVRVLGKPGKTTTLLEYDAAGKIREIWVMARPLTAVAAIAEAVGTQLTERRYPGRGRAIRALSRPLAGVAAVTNATGGRLIGDLNRSAA